MPARALVCTVVLVACAAGPRHRGAAQPTSRAIWDLLQQGDQYFDFADYRLAARFYDRAIDAAPFEVPPPAYARRARLFELRGQYEDGLRFLESKADRVYADDWEIHDQRLSLLQGAHRLEEASSLARRLFEKGRLSYRAALIVGLEEAGKCPRTSAQALERYLHMRPKAIAITDAVPRIQLGFQYLHLGDYADALTEFTAARAGSAAKVVLSNAAKGECAAYVGLERWREAVTACEASMTAGTLARDPSPWFNAARAYLELGRVDDAIAAADEYLGVRPDADRAHRLLERAYDARGDVLEARSHKAFARAARSSQGTGDGIPVQCLRRARAW